MLKTEKMQKVNIVVYDADIDKVTEGIAELGILHLMDISQTESWANDLQHPKLEVTADDCREREKRVDSLLTRLSTDMEGVSTLHEIGPLSLDEVDRELDKVEEEVKRVISERKVREEELKRLKEVYENVETFLPIGGIDLSDRYSFLEVALGSVESDNLELLRERLGSIVNVVMPLRKRSDGRTVVLVIALKKDKAFLEDIIRDLSFQREKIPVEAKDASADLRQEIGKKIEETEHQLEGIRSEERRVAEKFKPEFARIMAGLKRAEALAAIKGSTRKTERAYLLSGWIPASQRDNLIDSVRTSTDGRYFIEESEPGRGTSEEEETPVSFKNPAFLKPFEMLISTYDMPAYNTVDPTLFVAITFLIMFGAMFGDIGHGLILAAFGFFLRRKKKSESLRNAGILIFYAGISSVIFGALYGSVFGIEDLLPTLWLKPINNIRRFFKFAIFWGVAVITLGIIINIYNSFVKRDFRSGIFDKAGLLGGLIYWGGIALVVQFFLYKTGGINPLLAICLIVIPIALFSLREPILHIFSPRGKLFPDGVATYIMETLVEILDIFMGYLANTVSFIRVAAFSLAHTGLFIAIFTMSDMVSGGTGGSVLSAIVLIVGNAIIILLEGLVVTIQTIRLEYYEFFGKFFRSGGTHYKPVSFRG